MDFRTNKSRICSFAENEIEEKKLYFLLKIDV